VKRKALIIFLLSIFSAALTITVGAEKRPNGIKLESKSAQPLLPRFVSSSVTALFGVRQEATDLVLAGSIFLLLGLLSQKRAGRTVGHSKPSFLISPVRAADSTTRAGL
jgi:hypothetical protein